MPRARSESPAESDPGDLIADRTLRRLYDRFIGEIRGIHHDVTVRTAQLELRVYFQETLICRIVPYRELFHVQVGEKPVWETRVRDAADCVDIMDPILDRFFAVYTSRSHV
jgi:hypothetical protein